jgi:hypothetical protein
LWWSCWQPRLPLGFLCVSNNGLWQTMLLQVANATPDASNM